MPTNHVCMDYEPFKVEYTAGPAVRRRDAVDVPGAGRHAAWATSSPGMPGTGKIVWSKPEKFSVWCGVARHGRRHRVLRHARRLSQGVDANNVNKELWKFKTPSGIIGNVFTYEYKGKQYVGVYSGIGGWAGIGMAAGLEKDRTAWVPSAATRSWRIHGAGRLADRIRASHSNPATAPMPPRWFAPRRRLLLFGGSLKLARPNDTLTLSPCARSRDSKPCEIPDVAGRGVDDR